MIKGFSNEWEGHREKEPLGKGIDGKTGFSSFEFRSSVSRSEWWNRAIGAEEQKERKGHGAINDIKRITMVLSIVVSAKWRSDSIFLQSPTTRDIME